MTDLRDEEHRETPPACVRVCVCVFERDYPGKPVCSHYSSRNHRTAQDFELTIITSLSFKRLDCFFSKKSLLRPTYPRRSSDPTHSFIYLNSIRRPARQKFTPSSPSDKGDCVWSFSFLSHLDHQL